MKKKIHAEVILNQLIGIIEGWLIVMYLFPLFNHLEQSTVASISTLIFFFSSYARGYFIRVLFEGKK